MTLIILSRYKSALYSLGFQMTFEYRSLLESGENVGIDSRRFADSYSSGQNRSGEGERRQC